MQMRQRDCVAALDANTQKSSWMLPVSMLCVMMLPLVVVGCTSKQSVSQCVKPPPASGVDNAASPDWQTAERDYFALREILITMQKQLKQEPRSILMSSVDRAAHIDGQLMQLL